MEKNKKISFVIPCYRSENTITLVIDEIISTMTKNQVADYEIILVNDGSPDQVWNVIKEQATNNNKIKGINLAKNFGQHSALMAGYHNATGDYIVSLDDDGQSPADKVMELVEELEKGYDVVYASYPENHQNWFRRWGSKMAKKMSDYMFDIKDERTGSSYYIMRKFVMEEMIRYGNAYPYVGGLILRATRSISIVRMEHRDRVAGTSGYSLRGLISLWLNGFTAFSVKPLELGAYMGFIMAALGFLYAIYTIIRKIVVPTIALGWSSLISVMLIIGGIVMVMLGLIGEYIGRIYICLNNSPQFVVKEICDCNEEQ